MFTMRTDMTDVATKNQETEDQVEESQAVEAEPTNLSESESGDEHDEEDEEEVEVTTSSEKVVDDDLDRRKPQYIPKGGPFYEHDNRTLETDENSETKEVEKKKKVWKESKTSERWLHDCYVAEEQAPKTAEELSDIYGYDIRNEENAPRARRRRKYGRGPDKYERKWDDEQAYNASQKIGRGRGASNRRRTGEDFPPLPNQNGERLPQESNRGKSASVNKAWREVASKQRAEPRAASGLETSGTAKTPPRQRMEDHIKPFRHDGGSQKPQDGTIAARSRPLENKSPAAPAVNKDVQELSQSISNLSLQQKSRPKDPRGKEVAPDTTKNQPTENPANRQNPKRYSKIRKGTPTSTSASGFFPPEDCNDLDPREAKAALEMQRTTAQNRPMAHLASLQRQQDIVVQPVNVLQRFPDSYNGNATYLPGRTILQPIPQPGLSPQGTMTQTLSPQIAGMEMPPQPSFVPPPMFIGMGQGEVVPFQGYPAYPQGQNTADMYASSGITYYSPEIQTGTGQARALPQRRKAAIPIVPPPETH